MSQSRGISPWWALLILPVALVAGWGIGQIPAPKLEEPVSQPATTVSEPAPETSPVPDPPKADKAATESSLSPTPAKGAESPREVLSQWTTLQIAMLESERNGKPVMIDFNAEWCGPCKKMKEEVFDHTRLGRAVQIAVIPVSIVDRAREEGRNPPEIENLQYKFGVAAFPTLIVFSAHTGRIVKSEGYSGPDATAAWIVDAARAVSGR